MKKLLNWFVGVLCLGVSGCFSEAQDALPKAEAKSVTVIIEYLGANAEEVESGVTTQIENAISHTPGISRVASASYQGISEVEATLDPKLTEKQIDELRMELFDRVGAVQGRLPELVESLTFSPTTRPTYWILLLVAGSDGAHQRFECVDELRMKLLALPDVSQIRVIGQPKPKMLIEIDRKQLAAHGLSMETVSKAIAENFGQRAGTPNGFDVKSIGVSGEPLAEQLGEMLLRADKSGKAVKLKDVAEITLDQGSPPPVSLELNTRSAVGLFVGIARGKTRAKTAETVENLLREVEKMRPAGTVIDAVSCSRSLGLVPGSDNQRGALWTQLAKPRIVVDLRLLPGTSRERETKILRRVESFAMRLTGVTGSVAFLGTDVGSLRSSHRLPRTECGQILLSVDDASQTAGLVEKLNKFFEDGPPGTDGSAAVYRPGRPPEGAVAVRFLGKRGDQLLELVDQGKAILREENAQHISDDWEPSLPEVAFDIDRKEAAKYGVNSSDVLETVRWALHGQELGVMNVGNQHIRIVMKSLASKYPNGDVDIGNITVHSQTAGATLLLSTIADIKQVVVPQVIRRRDGRHCITVTCRLDPAELDATVARVKKRFAALELLDGYQVQWVEAE